MFDIGWSELLVLGIVTLIFVGPKELPALMRTLGRYAGVVRRHANEFKAHFDDAMREIELEDMRKEMDAMRDSVNADIMKAQESLNDAIKDSGQGNALNGPASQAPSEGATKSASASAPEPASPPTPRSSEPASRERPLGEPPRPEPPSGGGKG